MSGKTVILLKTCMDKITAAKKSFVQLVQVSVFDGVKLKYIM